MATTPDVMRAAARNTSHDLMMAQARAAEAARAAAMASAAQVAVAEASKQAEADQPKTTDGGVILP